MHSVWLPLGITQLTVIIKQCKIWVHLQDTYQWLHSLPDITEPSVASFNVPFSKTVMTLGVVLDDNLSLNQHVRKLCNSLHFHTHAMHHIWPALTISMAATLEASLIQSCLHCANSILYRTSTSNINKLQCAQNSLAHTVLCAHHDLSS